MALWHCLSCLAAKKRGRNEETEDPTIQRMAYGVAKRHLAEENVSMAGMCVKKKITAGKRRQLVAARQLEGWQKRQRKSIMCEPGRKEEGRQASGGDTVAVFLSGSGR